MDTLFNKADQDLIKDYLKRESRDYSPVKDQDWIDSAFKLLERKLSTYPLATTCTITSLGNVGCESRHISLDTRGKGWKTIPFKETTAVITLCPCGKLECLVR